LKISKGQQRPPKRSCLSCVRAKARCDFSAGKCARCKYKGLSCEWPQRKGYLPRTGTDPSNQPSSKSEMASVPLIPSALPATGQSEHPLENTSESCFQRDSSNDFYQFANDSNFFGMPSPLGTVDSASDSFSGLSNETHPDLDSIASRLAIYGAPFSSFHLTNTSGISLPQRSRPISTANHLLAFQCRTYSDLVQRNSAATIVRILSSYPTMMIRRETFPPFIHPQCIPDYELDQPLLHPLDKCMEIARAFKYRTPQNSEMVWRAIKLEYERLTKEVCLPQVLSDI
jgi:hypothetical protein